MAVDKLVDSTQLDADLTSVANAIRTKGGTSAQLAFPAGFVSAVQAIPSGGADYPDYTTILTRSKTGIFTDDHLTSVGDGALSRIKCTTVHLSKVTSCGIQSFNGTTTLKTAVFPLLTSIGQQAFNSCSALVAVDFKGNASSGIAIQAFASSTNLKTIIIRGNAVCKLANINAFASSPFASGKAGGTLYVPSALLSSYQSATNWSTILGYSTNQILPIEGSSYETQYVDGTPIA